MKSRMRSLFGLLLSLTTLVMFGCGGDDGGASTTVSGTAAKGPILGGTVTFFQIKADGKPGEKITTTPATVTTKSSAPSFGNYSASIGFSGPVLVKVTGGSYTDEATGETVQMGANSLMAAIPNATGSVRAAVTPITDVAARKLTSNTEKSITTANANVAAVFGLTGVNIITASPTADPKYKFALAVISQAAGPDATAVTTLLTQAAAGIDAATGIATQDVIDGIAVAQTAAFNNPRINPTGTIPGIDPNAVSAVNITASPSTGAINTPVTISANVTKISGGPAADGTAVVFTTSAGTLSATTATTSNGVATATLSGVTSPQAVTVTAKASIFTSSLIVNFVNPDAPASIIVTANPATSFIGLPVTISAAVTRAAGGPVPDGTNVTFAASAGTITASATTTNGVATATLNGVTTAQAVTVTATAGTVTSSPLSVTFNNDPNTPGGISVAANPALLFIGQGPVTITATVTPAGQGGVIADGTSVTFITTAGVLTSPTSTVNGVATVLLNSTTAATASVTARVNTITSAPAVVEFVDPNKPGAVSLAAAPTSGVTAGQSPVTLTATVTPASLAGTLPVGTPVTFSVLTGTGTITAATTTNAAGVATAILNSTVAGTITVNATAGTAPVVTSNTVSVPFIVQPTLAIVKVATTGTLPVGTTIGGVNAIISAVPSAGLTIAAADVAASGAALGSLAATNAANVAAVNVGLINTTGFQVGEFATLTYHIAAGTIPKAADFTVALTGAGVIDSTNANIPGIAVTVLSVTLQ